MIALAHLVGLPVEEALPFVIPVAGVWLIAGKHWIHYHQNRMQSTRRRNDGEHG